MLPAAFRRFEWVSLLVRVLPSLEAENAPERLKMALN